MSVRRPQLDSGSVRLLDLLSRVLACAGLIAAFVVSSGTAVQAWVVPFRSSLLPPGAALFAYQSVVPAEPSAPESPGNVAAGQALFTGQKRLSNGGPSCASCHNVATVPFPRGGTMAPDLTHEYSKLGPEGMHYALRTLYFPAMNALFLKRQLTDQEERDLAAFFQNADQSQPGTGLTGIFGAVALLGLGVLVAGTWISGRGRVHSVRRALLKRAGIDREVR